MSKKLIYTPTDEGYMPGLEPGSVLVLDDRDEITRLLEAGLFTVLENHDEEVNHDVQR